MPIREKSLEFVDPNPLFTYRINQTPILRWSLEFVDPIQFCNSSILTEEFKHIFWDDL